MDRHVLLRLLLKIVLLLSFACCTLPARLQWNSSRSASRYDKTPIGQPARSSNVTRSLYDTIPLGQLPSSSLSLSQATNVTIGYINVTRAPTQIPSSPSPRPSATSPSPSASFIQRGNMTVRQLNSSSPSSNNYTSVGESITPSAGASRGGLNLLGKIGIAIAVVVVSLVILIAVINAFKKKRATHNDVGDSLVAGTNIRAYTTGQLANPSGSALEVGIMEIRTHTVEEVNSMEVGIDVRTYTVEELRKATNNFTTKVGKGVSGFVYRANLPGDSRIGAVKRATDLDPNLFKQELSVLLRLPRHPHLVDLIGLCLQPGEPILIFEFISNGNLHDRLHKNNKGVTSPLSWTARMDIAYQVALALQYLHEEAKPPILHRDVKSANVLLVNDNSAKLADFGLSKLGPKNNQFTVTAVRGSYGYMDPQYVKTRRYSAKSDVYSFGVLLLELITGLKALHDDTPLAEWTAAYRLIEDKKKFIAIVDPNMIDHVNMMEVQNMVNIANLCLAENSEERCLMREIVNMMQETRNMNGNVNLPDGGEVPLLGNGNLV